MGKGLIIVSAHQAGPQARRLEKAEHAGQVQLGPLSVQQQWLVNWTKGSPANWQGMFYNFSLKIEGQLSEDGLDQSICDAVKRHDALRTSIIVAENDDFQVAVKEADSFKLEIIDLSEYGQEVSYLIIQSNIRDFLLLNNQPTNTTPFWPKLYRLSSKEHILTVVFHHVCSDHYSWVLFFSEMWTKYYDLVRGMALDSFRASGSYLDYAIAQRRDEQSWLLKHAPYWQSKLGAVSQISCIDQDGLTETIDIELVQRTLTFPDEIRTELFQLAQRLHTIPAILMLGIYAWVVSMSSGNTDYILPISLNGRQRAEQFKMIGVFSQYLYLRIKRPLETKFCSFLKLIQNEYFAALRHQDCGWVSEKYPGHFSGAIFNYISGPLDGLIALPPSSIRNNLSELKVELMPGFVQSGIIYSRKDATEAILHGRVSALFYEDGHTMFCKLFCTDELTADIHEFFEVICKTIHDVYQDCPTL